MATRKLEKLYEYLMDSRFDFLGRGTHEISEIYSGVRLRYGSLCDNRYMCSDNCQSGHPEQPEWKHTVRSALNQLREKKLVWHGKGRGMWVLKQGAKKHSSTRPKRKQGVS